MAKTCKNCGATLEDEATYCLKCKHNPDEVWSPEKDESLKQKEKKSRKKRMIISIVVVVVLAVAIVFIVRSCTFYRSYNISGDYAPHHIGQTAKLTDFKQSGKKIALKFKANDDISYDMISDFASDVTIDDCSFDKISCRLSEDPSFTVNFSTPYYCKKGDTFILLFSAPDSSYKVSRGKLHIPAEYR